MPTKSAREMELEDAIAQSVAALDAADGSRIGLQEGMDSARETLGDAYGIGFEKAGSAFAEAVLELAEYEDDADADEDEDEADAKGDGNDAAHDGWAGERRTDNGKEG